MAPSTAETTSWNGFLEKSHLPLYEELEQTDHSDHALPTPDLPGLNATPTQVSEFLFELLVSTKAMSSDEQARDVAARWKLGTG